MTAVRKNRIVVWLDADENYCDFVDQLIQLRANQQIPYEVKAYCGSHLELLLRIEKKRLNDFTAQNQGSIARVAARIARDLSKAPSHPERKAVDLFRPLPLGTLGRVA